MDVVGLAVYTNNPPGGAFRGFGVSQSAFATECNLNLLAEKVGMSGGNIAAIECGRRSEANLTLATAIKLCDALKVRNPRKLLDSDSETSAD